MEAVAPVLICNRMYFLTADDIIDIIAMTTFISHGIHSQCMLGNLAQYGKLRSAVSQSDWHKVGSVDGRSANCRSRNWRSKIQLIDDQF